MSASRERKERANNKTVAQPKKKEKKKVSQGLILFISIVAVLIAVFGTVLGIRYYQRNRTVMTVSGNDISVKQFNHYFVEIANQVGSYASYVGIDTTTPIDEQKVSADSSGMLPVLGLDTECLEPYKQEDGSYDITWARYFALLAKETAAGEWSRYAAAMSDPNYTVPAEVENSIKEEMDSLKAVAKENNVDADEYVEYYYGEGCNEETYETFVRTRYIASDYVNNYRFSAEDIDSKYAEAQADFDVVTFLSYSVSASQIVTEQEEAEAEAEKAEEGEEPSEKPSEESSEELSEEEKAAIEAEKLEAAKPIAKERAEAMEASFNEEDEDVSLYADYNREAIESYITKEAAAWLFETANIGDVKLFANEDGTTYYVIKLVANDVNYLTSNFLQICIAADSTSAEEHVHVEGEEHAVEDMTAAEKVEAIQAALKENSSEENFRALSDTYNTQPDYLEMEDTSYAYLANYVSKEAFNWNFAGLKAGDYQVFENDNATYILFYLGTSDTYRNLSVNAKLVTEMVENLTKEALENCNFDMDAAMKGSVSLVMSAGY